MTLSKLRKQLSKLKAGDANQLTLAKTTTTTSVTGSDGSVYVYQKCDHPATTPIKIGGFDVWLGACRDISPDTLKTFDYIFPLSDQMPNGYFGSFLPIIRCALPDRGGVPEYWPKFIEEVVKLIRDGKKILGYCMGGHGRTGTFAASLIAVMEPETKDPVAAIRKRHCVEAVESKAQTEAIFKLKGIDKLPEEYEKEFAPSKSVGHYSGGYCNDPKDTTCDFDKYKNTKYCYNQFCLKHRSQCDVTGRGWENCRNKYCPEHGAPQDVQDLVLAALTDGIIEAWGMSYNIANKYWLRPQGSGTSSDLSVEELKQTLAGLRAAKDSSTTKPN